MAPIHCTNCNRPYPDEGAPYRCPVCGGIYDFTGPPEFNESSYEPTLPGVWPYRHSFGLPEDARPVSLGEGKTPLVECETHGKKVFYKLESLNPTGSFKDRGAALLASFLLARGVESAVEDSSGNAGASFAAYAAHTGIQARVFIPDAASGPKRIQIGRYGAEVVRILGPRSNTAEAVRREAEKGAVYASHAYLPFALPGYATIAYEIVRQLGQGPGTVIAPVGHASLLYGVARGFQALAAVGAIAHVPILVGVQARACAPLWALHAYGADGLSWVTEGDTLAEGVRVRHPLRGDALLRILESSEGMLLAVDEGDILPGRDQLARRGLYVEPTSAIVWDAIRQIINRIPEPIVVILTGSGLKTL